MKKIYERNDNAVIIKIDACQQESNLNNKKIKLIEDSQLI